MTLVRLFARGFLIVTVTAANVANIAHGEYPHALVGGFLISFIWWTNSRTASHSEARFGREAYAAGAALGTVCGMWLARYAAR